MADRLSPPGNRSLESRPRNLTKLVAWQHRISEGTAMQGVMVSLDLDSEECPVLSQADRQFLRNPLKTTKRKTERKKARGPCVIEKEFKARKGGAGRAVMREGEHKEISIIGRFSRIPRPPIQLSLIISTGFPSSDTPLPEGESMLTNYHTRAWESLQGLWTSAMSPTTDKLLPDPLPPPYLRPLTLCIELTDGLVHLEWEVR
ncbi:hypothetical protein BDK51DRAFT_42617 [Blyttiomyces helicus]|uniref:Uncharacterized protein n=1 Tax=Blyttiomyces helicus TaxID=388810 RepID=A0A4P9VU50_9FUNG|nr:hypothetical protein BDK51DRAFT_42617 [Blyttiomyces helicus]|eukprot:RKO83091.1 hypothetical protein BDK51DRAFT_42617 [Blyttiomyces helicus]